VESALAVLEERFSTRVTTIVVATAMHSVVRTRSGNADPYSPMKARELAIARELFPKVRVRYGDDLRSLIKLAALGNTIDFFRKPEDILPDMERQLEFTVDNIDQFARKLTSARRILFLADNAGEVLFDLPLMSRLRRTARVTYAVKSAPVQDDTTIEDLVKSGLRARVGDVITTGTATPGVDFSQASGEFLAAFARADLVFAKGMGYYESLTELPAIGRVFHCLMAKCEPVANDIGVPPGSYVAMVR
jgi:uncharacterized protein with ATP-grasp and redox domains